MKIILLFLKCTVPIFSVNPISHTATARSRSRLIFTVSSKKIPAPARQHWTAQDEAQGNKPAHAETGNDVNKCGEKAAVLPLVQEHR